MPTVKVISVQKQNVPLVVRALAQIHSLRQIQIGAEQAGRITAILVKNGDEVKQGQILFLIDDRQQRAAVADAGADLMAKQQHYQRLLQLYKQGAVDSDDLDTSKSAYLRAQSNLQEMQKALDQTKVRAPFAGHVTYTDLAVGSYVNVGDSLIGMVNDQYLELQYDLPAEYWGKPKMGQSVLLTSDAFPNKTFTATVNYVAPQLNPDNHAFTVRAALDSHDHALAPGLSVIVTHILDNTRQVLAVPGISLIGDPSGFAVDVVENQKIIKKSVKIGTQFKEWTEIKSGLKEGDEVVIEGQMRVREGQPVKVVQA